MKITLFTFFNQVKEQLSFEEMLSRIKSGYYESVVEPLRRMLAAGDKKGYDLGKRLLIAFTAQAWYDGGRKEACRLGYNQIVVLDIDNLSAAMLLRVKATLMLCEYTLACFISPSGNGLKVFSRVSTGPEEHQQAFKSLQLFYQTLTGVQIDPSGKDISRLCFVSVDRDLYYNPAATVFVPTSSNGNSWPAAIPKQPVVKGTLVQEDVAKALPALSVIKPDISVKAQHMLEVYRQCRAEMERTGSYVDGHRNAFLFTFSLHLRRAGLSISFTTKQLLKDYDLDEKEVRTCVKSAYSYNWVNDVPSAAPPPVKKAEPVAVAAFHDVNELVCESEIESSAPDLPVTEVPEDQPKDDKPKGRQLYKLSVVEDELNKWVETRYNEVRGAVEWRPVNSKKMFKRITDHDENSWFRKLHNGGQIIPINTLHVLLNSDFSRAVHPFKEYFKQLPKWDGVTDYIGQLCDTVKTEDDAYWRFCFRKWFVAFVTSLWVDDVINHTCIVFVGGQGIGKTQWMKLLVPKIFKSYIGAATLHSDSKDMIIMLAECVLIILDEMEVNHKNLEAFKELITRSEILIRRPYGRNTESLDRISSFYACVNHEQILTDPTGSRRYLCSKVTWIDYEHTVDIEGAMAQAIALYESGFRYWFDQDEIRELTDRNEIFMSKTVEEELIETWVRPVTQAEWDNRHKFANSQNIKRLTTTQLAIILMEKARINLVDPTVVKLGLILTKKKFVRVRLQNNFSWLVRIVTSDVVELNSHSMGEKEVQQAEQEANDQIIRFEEDLFNSTGDDGLPF